MVELLTMAVLVLIQKKRVATLFEERLQIAIVVYVEKLYLCLIADWISN